MEKYLKDLGYKGKEIGEKLNFLLDEVIKNHLLNKKGYPNKFIEVISNL